MECDVEFVPSVVLACCTLHNIIEELDKSFDNSWSDQYNAYIANNPQPNDSESEELDESDENDEDPENQSEAEKIRTAISRYMERFPQMRSQRRRFQEA